jgi:hypothetical protein
VGAPLGPALQRVFSAVLLWVPGTEKLGLQSFVTEKKNVGIDRYELRERKLHY